MYALLFLLLFTGCTTYSHTELADGSWETKVFRSWGTNNLEALIDMRSERISVGGDGISDNMADVIVDSIERAVKAAIASQTGGGSALIEEVIDAAGDTDGEAEAYDPP